MNEIAEDLFRDLATYLVEKVYCESVTTVTVGCVLVMHFAHCDCNLLVKYTPYSSLTEFVTRYLCSIFIVGIVGHSEPTI